MGMDRIQWQATVTTWGCVKTKESTIRVRNNQSVIRKIAHQPGHLVMLSRKDHESHQRVSYSNHPTGPHLEWITWCQCRTKFKMIMIISILDKTTALMAKGG